MYAFWICSCGGFCSYRLSHTVNLYAGNKGTVNGSDKVTISNLSANDNVDFSSINIAVTDQKYYAKGVRLSGRNNDDVVFSSPSFPVNGDADYVVAYGISANRVSYVVNYQDAAGNALAPSNTFYGDAGDKPVVAYRYIENYIPQGFGYDKEL